MNVFAAFVHEGPEVTYTGSVHNAEVLSPWPAEGSQRLAHSNCGPSYRRGAGIVFHSTTKETPAAKRIAAQIIESFWDNAGRGAESLKLRNNDATIGELIHRYQFCVYSGRISHMLDERTEPKPTEKKRPGSVRAT